MTVLTREEQFNAIAKEIPEFTARIEEICPENCGVNWKISCIVDSYNIARRENLSIENPNDFDTILTKLTKEEGFDLEWAMRHGISIGDPTKLSDKRLDAQQQHQDFLYHGKIDV